MRNIVFVLFFSLIFMQGCFAKKKSNLVEVETNKGKIVIQLFPEKAPKSVENFLVYVKEGFYTGTIFHRVIDNFMIQGGGFDEKMNKKKTKKPIENEAANGLNNLKGTLAFARTNVINSATSQFFINLKDNTHLDHKSKTQRGFGYAVFGKVTSGMSVINMLAKVAVGVKSGHQNVPNSPIIIKSIKISE